MLWIIAIMFQQVITIFQSILRLIGLYTINTYHRLIFIQKFLDIIFMNGRHGKLIM
jgi:hypothetical protein